MNEVIGKVLRIAEKSRNYLYQGPRFKKLGPNSGEEFRDSCLIPFLDSLDSGERGIVDFYGTEVFSPSFLEESFGGAIRKGYGDKVEALDYVNIPPEWRKELERYVADASRRK